MQQKLAHACSSVFCKCRQLNVAVNKFAQVAESDVDLAKGAELIIGCYLYRFLYAPTNITALGKN